MNKWVVVCIVLSAAAALGMLNGLLLNNRPPYNHVLTTVERIDEDEDALRVFHDKVRGVTCYQTYGAVGAMSCVPDMWLTPHHDASAP